MLQSIKKNQYFVLSLIFYEDLENETESYLLYRMLLVLNVWNNAYFVYYELIIILKDAITSLNVFNFKMVK